MVAYDPGRCPGLCKGKALQAFGRMEKASLQSEELFIITRRCSPTA